MKLSPARQIVIAVLALALIGLQIRLWFGEGSLRDAAQLHKQVQELEQKNQALAERNRLLAADVHDLKDGSGAIEEIARKDLGMIRNGETFFLVMPGADDAAGKTPDDKGAQSARNGHGKGTTP